MLSVVRLRSSGLGGSVVDVEGGGEIVVEPWPRASRERIPAEGSRFFSSDVRAAKERPEEPAPWCVMNRGAVGPMGEVR